MSNVNLNISELDQSLLVKLDQYIASLEDPNNSLINVLHKAQQIFGYIPHNLQLYISRKVGVSAARVNGVVSFYSYFTEKKTGKNVVSVCMGTACYVKGAGDILKELLKQLNVEKNDVSEDTLFTVKDVRCIGACGLAPVVTVGEKVYGHVTKDMVKDIINTYKERG
ncbi:MAG: NADH-quinone oxidoreductase subunit NuoE family protein [Candidatus Izemoplasmataceae bacterium]